MTTLVTGGAGFIGSNLVRHLLEQGERVRVLDDASTGHAENLDGLDVELVRGDLRDAGTVRSCVDGVELVYHLGAIPSVARSVEDPASTHDVNVNGTINVLRSAGEARVRRVVFASSSAVYGETPGLPRTEDQATTPISPYGASKLAGEAYCRAFSRVFGLETVSLRFFNVFGPRQDPASEYASAVPRFVSRLLDGEPPIVFGDGHQSRDFTHVANVVRACTLAAQAGPGAVGEAINVGCGVRTSVLDLIGTIAGIVGAEVEPMFAPPRPGDVRDSEASLEKAERLLGYRPAVSVRDGLADAVAWFRDRRAAITR